MRPYSPAVNSTIPITNETMHVAIWKFRKFASVSSSAIIRMPATRKTMPPNEIDEVVDVAADERAAEHDHADDDRDDREREVGAQPKHGDVAVLVEERVPARAGHADDAEDEHVHAGERGEEPVERLQPVVDRNVRRHVSPS